MHTDTPRRAVGLIRVSHVGDRAGDQYVSPKVQREQIERWCERENLELIAVYDEQDVSGGNQLDKRPGLAAAVAAIENRFADVAVASNFDRLFRSVAVQQQVVDRIEKAGGNVAAVDTGHVSNGNAGQWISSTMLGVVAEYVRRSTGERSRAAVVRRVAEGAVPYKVQTPGLGVDENGRLRVTDQAQIDVVERALEMRASGRSFTEIRTFLRDNGIARSLHGTQTLLRDKLLVGWVKFGELENRNAHEPFVNPDTWRKANDRHNPRGRRSPSDRLLARLGVLHCGTCGSRMIVASGGVPVYRCATMSTGDDCAKRAAISCHIAERVIVEETLSAIAAANVEGEASPEAEAVAAQTDADAAQVELDTLLETFTAAGVVGEPAAVKRLAGVRAKRDNARALADRLLAATARRRVTVADWDKLTTDEQRDLIRSTLTATVAPAGPGLVGASRISVQVVGE